MRYRALLSSLAVLVLLFAALPAADVTARPGSHASNQEKLHITDKTADIVVQVNGAAAYGQVLKLVSSKGIKLKFSSESAGIMTLNAPSSDSTLVGELAAIGGVVDISSETTAHALFTPNDTYVSQQWGLSAVNAYGAWDVTRGTHSVVVAVLDTGIDWNHPDLAANIWNDSSGYHGYNFIAGNRIPMDDNINGYTDTGQWVPGAYTYHGTHVAGII